MKKKISLLMAACLMFVAVGCISPDVMSTSRINLIVTDSGTSTPTAIHMFALETDENFRRLDYFELMKKKRSKLGGDIISQSKQILAPGGTIRKSIKLLPNVRYFAVVAGVRNVQDNDNWRYIQILRAEHLNNLNLTLDNSGLHKIYR